ncbi:hypothetical protein C8J45_103336 [Sphingomonas sp. PP-CE-3G-477]|nr:hypothetical protein C8J45_103336 [Sphingomonas sp. PP-CE-3G-477]
MTRHTPSPTANAQDVTASPWVNWTGGICPVPTDTMIMTRLRNGWLSSGPAKAGYHRWDHGRTPESPLRANDIVAYRVVQS